MFKVGDVVRVLDTVPTTWWFKPGWEGVIVEREPSHISRFRYGISFPGKEGIPPWYKGGVDDEHISHIKGPW